MKFAIRNILILISFAVIASAQSSRWPTEKPIFPEVDDKAPGFDARGEVIQRGEFPWIVALLDKREQPQKYFCGGTLISPKFVLSTAQCFQPKVSDDDVEPKKNLEANDVTAVFGAHDLRATEVGTIALSPKKVIIHVNWTVTAEDYDSDVALLEFNEGAIPISEHIHPIYLWTSTIDPPMDEGVVVGWTKTENVTREHLPKKLTVPIQTNEECFLTTKALLYFSSRKTFCAGFRNFSRTNTKKKGICRGDRGSGLFITVDGAPHLKGMMSMNTEEAESKCDVSRNSVYANVLKFSDWIVNMTQMTPGAFKAPKPPVIEVGCTVQTLYLRSREAIKTCKSLQPIDDEETVLEIRDDLSVKAYISQNNKLVKFIPKRIGERLPNLVLFLMNNCSLTIVRDTHFKDLRRLSLVDLSSNQIATVEPGSFKDLTRLKTLDLSSNKIETLDEKMFANLARLEVVDLSSNRIRTLSPKTFTIQGGQLYEVYLLDNVCINLNYRDPYGNLDRLKKDLRRSCSDSQSYQYHRKI